MSIYKISRENFNKQKEVEKDKISVSQILTQGIIEIINEVYTKQYID